MIFKEKRTDLMQRINIQRMTLKISGNLISRHHARSTKSGSQCAKRELIPKFTQA